MENKIKSLIKKLSRLGFNVKPKEGVHTDPVCGMESSGDLFKTDYQSRSYYFCSDHCRGQFEKDPKSYVSK
ncbi:MAG: YHS domain-containing protein [Patescibacteria group bacterium]